MKVKSLIYTILLTFIAVGLFVIDYIYNRENIQVANSVYQIYLNGNKLGFINDENELYNLINREQEQIKELYGVDQVYPPVGFNIIKTNTFTNEISKVEDVYSMIAQREDFMIKGYIITINFEDEDKANIKINVVNKSIFEEAIKQFIFAFLPEEEYNNYIEGHIEEITEKGSVIQSMYFNETLTIKEGYISVNDKIFTEVSELSQFLLFGEDAEVANYTVKLGDTISTISEEHRLNSQEFIIANPVYRNENVVLKVGTVVNVTLLNPILTFIYEVFQIEEVETPFTTKVVYSTEVPAGYNEITTPGVTGLTLTRENYQVINGEQSSEIKISNDYQVVREMVEQVRTIGRTYSSSGTYVNIAGDWGWPTLQPSSITSRYGYRWGRIHEGVDISGTGYGSPIFAIGDGEVVNVKQACSSCAQWSNGMYVVVKHANNYYSAYLHLSAYNVKVGDIVQKGQRIASMGDSGYVTGVHLHLGFYEGEPFVGGTTRSLNPLTTLYNMK